MRESLLLLRSKNKWACLRFNTTIHIQQVRMQVSNLHNHLNGYAAITNQLLMHFSSHNSRISKLFLFLPFRQRKTFHKEFERYWYMIRNHGIIIYVQQFSKLVMKILETQTHQFSKVLARYRPCVSVVFVAIMQIRVSCKLFE